MVPAKTIRVPEWEGLSLCRVLRKKDLQFTDRLTQENCKLTTMTTFCSGGKCPSFFLLSRSGNEWRVGPRGSSGANLVASLGDNTLIPRSTGWKFYNGKSFEEDPHLTCNSTDTSSSCCVTVSLSGLAKEIQRECEGEYKDTGLRSTGRKVINFLM